MLRYLLVEKLLRVEPILVLVLLVGAQDVRLYLIANLQTDRVAVALSERIGKCGVHAGVCGRRRDLDTSGLRVDEPSVAPASGSVTELALSGARFEGLCGILLVLQVDVLLECGIERLEPRKKPVKGCILLRCCVGINRPLLRLREDLTARNGNLRAAGDGQRGIWRLRHGGVGLLGG